MLVIDYDLCPSVFRHTALQRGKPLFITEAVISVSLIDQLLRILKVQPGRVTLTLYIRTDSAVLIRTLVMYKPRLFQRMVDNLQSPFHKTLLIRVLYPEHEISVLMLCDQICIKRRS